MRSFRFGMSLFLMAVSSHFLFAQAAGSIMLNDTSLRFRDVNLPLSDRVSDLISRLTLQEKVMQMQNNAPAIERLGIPAYNWWNECLHGVARNGLATVFPQAIGMAATWNPNLIGREADVISTEARAKYRTARANGTLGIYQGLTFWSPNINIFRDPRWGRGQETYGEDPFLTGRIGVAFVKGLQGPDPKYYKVIATAKHYAVHSGPEAMRHGFDAWCSERDLYETYLPAFEALVKEGKVASVMGAYNRFWGEPCSASDLLLDRILRKQWGFGGYVTTDCGAIWDIYHGHSLQPDSIRASALAINAGSDLTCGNEYSGLVEAVKRGYLPETTIDRAVSRLFEARFRLGMFDPDSLVRWTKIPATENDSPGHRELALQVARESMVLLKNENHLLPFGSRIRTIAVIGPYANSIPVLLGNYNGTPAAPVTILEGIRVRAGNAVRILYEAGKSSPDSALGIASQADVVVFVGGISPELEGEELDLNIEGFYRGDRTALNLPFTQERLMKLLVKTGKPVVLVLTNGSALSIAWEKDSIPAIVEAWYPGQAGGTAVAELLFGDYNPAGRLPVTFYRSVKDLPPFEDYSMAGRTYRYFKGESLYPFGHGLSYTGFVYLSAVTGDNPYKAGDTIHLSLTLKNSGERDGDEVAQVYMTRTGSAFVRPVKTLVGFLRIPLAAGEIRTVTIPLPVKLFRVYDPETGNFLVETGVYMLQVGASSADIRLQTEVKVMW
jgi:beta-glucosidase